jgi:hypothetical protein
MLALALSALVSTTHAAAPQAWVVLSRRTGITGPKALAAAADVSSKLKGVPVPATVDDLTSCKAKRVCLIEAARKKQVAVLVTVEVGAVLDDATLRVEGLSIDEDGKSLGTVEADGPLAGLVAKAEPKLSGEFSTTLRSTLGLVPPPQPKVEPTPVVVAPLVTAPPPQEPTPASAVTVAPAVTAEAKPGFGAGRIAGLVVGGAGVAALAVGGVFLAQASSGAAQVKALCPEAQCSKPEAFTTYNQAAQSQNLGVALSVAGGVALVAGAVVFLVNPGATAPAASAVVVPVQGGVMSSFSMSF